MSEPGNIGADVAKKPIREGFTEKGTFAPGNKLGGKKPGSRNRATIIAQALIDGAADRVIQTLIQKAEEGDSMALKLVVDRLAPARKTAPITFELPTIDGLDSAKKALADIIAAQAAGELSADEAEGLASTVEKYIKVAQVADLEARVDRLEIVRTVIDVTRSTSEPS